jgi:hypothetical protein
MRSARWFGYSLHALALGLAVTAVLGPLVTGTIDYRYSESMVNQAVGLDAFALTVVAPLAVLSGVLVLRRHPAAPLLALGPSGFAAYMLVQYVIGPEYLTIDGNGERFFLLFLGLFVLSAVLVFEAWSLAEHVPHHDRRIDRRRGAVLLVLAAFVVFGMYLSNGFVSAMADFPSFVAQRAATTEYDEHPTAYWLIASLDLGIVAPLAVATAIALLRGLSWGTRAYYGVVGWFTLVPGSVAAMAATMLLRDDPAAQPGRAAVLAVAAVVFTGLGVRAFLRLFRRNGIVDVSSELDDVSTTFSEEPDVHHHHPVHAHR